MRYKAFGLLRL